MNTANENDSRRLGAMTALLGMGRLERMADEYNATAHDENDTAEYFIRKEAEAIRTFTNLTEPLSPFMTGFVEAMTEALLFHATTGTPDYMVWKPSAAMTESEREEYRSLIEASFVDTSQVVEGGGI